jgi:hypothetical protein
MMVKITYMPWNEIIIHEIREFDVQHFFETIITQLQAQGQTGLVPSCNWIDGIAFVLAFFPDSEEVVKEKLEGRLHYGAVHFTRMNYQHEKKAVVAGREYTLRLVKADDNPDLVDLVKSIKANFKEKTS